MIPISRAAVVGNSLREDEKACFATERIIYASGRSSTWKKGGTKRRVQEKLGIPPNRVKEEKAKRSRGERVFRSL